MKQHFSRTAPSTWISCLGILAVAGMFLHWWVTTPSIALPGRIAAGCSALLFIAVGLRFVPRWMQFWQAEQPPLPCPETGSEPPHMLPKLFIGLLAVNFAIIIAVYGLRCAAGHTGTFLEQLSFWTCTDSAHYLDIARDWYLSHGPMDRLVQLVFLPGYPIAIRLMQLLIPHPLYAAMTLSSLCFAGAGCVLYRLFRLDFPHRDALRAIRYLCILPGAFFFAAPMSESLFLLLCAGCLYCIRKNRWALGCLLGGYAAFTRSLGAVLLVPVCMELIAAFRQDPIAGKKTLPRRLACLLLIPAGSGAYCLINYQVSGDPFQFMLYQNEHWNQQLGYFFNTAAYQTQWAIHTAANDPHNFWGLWLPNLLWSFGALGLMAVAAPRIRPSFTAWFMAYFFIAIGATWLLSAPRYLVAFFPLPMALAICTRNQKIDLAATLLCLILSCGYLYAFVMRWQVW